MLDKLDRRILQELERDSRQSMAGIARRLKTNKTIVNYRFERLQKRNIVRGFHILTNQVLLGKLSFGILLRWNGLLADDERLMKDRLRAIPQISWMSSINGRWDMMIVVIERDMQSFCTVMQRIFCASQGHIREYSLYVDYAGSISGHDYLYDTPKDISVEYGAREDISISQAESEVYDRLKSDPRMSLLQIAQELGKTYDTIQSKFRRLKETGIILRCAPLIDIALLGYQDSLTLLNISPNKERVDELRSFCRKHPNIVRQADCFGHFQMILNIHSRDSNHLREIIGEIRKRYSDIINSFEIIQSIQ